MARTAEPLTRALGLRNKGIRLLETAAVVAEALGRAGLRPVVVGPLALSHWTDRFVVADCIELAMPAADAVDECLAELGLEAHDNGWRAPAHAITIILADEGLEPSEATARVEVPSGRALTLLSAEDVLVRRLEAFVATGEAEATAEAVAMLDVTPLDSARLEQRASAAGLTAALAELRAIATRIEQGEHLHVAELAELADRLR